MNPKKYHEQLSLTRSSTKNELFEITKECKEFNFQQNLLIEFTKNDEAFKKQNIQNPMV